MKFTLEVEKHFETKSIFALTKIRMWLLCGGPPHCSTPRSVLLKHLGGTFFLPRPPDPQTRKRTISRGSLLAAPRFQTQFCIHQPQILKTKLKSPRKEKGPVSVEPERVPLLVCSRAHPLIQTLCPSFLPSSGRQLVSVTSPGRDSLAFPHCSE